MHITCFLLLLIRHPQINMILLCTAIILSRDPFVAAVHLRQQHPLMVFQESPDIDNTHWLTNFPVWTCRKHRVGPTPVLCSGSVMGSREGILDYIDTMADEIDYWKTRPECRFDMPGDDQVNAYFYSTKQPVCKRGLTSQGKEMVKLCIGLFA